MPNHLIQDLENLCDPTYLYGVEVLNHTLTDIKKLERLQVQICKQIQGLPERTANLAAYSLLGVEPIELVVDRLADLSRKYTPRQNDHQISNCRDTTCHDENKYSEVC